jgi:PAS domain S-box-containing protein
MATAGVARRAPIEPNYRANFIVALLVLYLGAAVLLYFSADDPSLHSVLDTSVVVTSALIALLLWDSSRRMSHSWPLFLAISVAIVAVGELVHMATVLGWLGEGPEADIRLRAATWGPTAYLMPIGFGAALLLRRWDRTWALPLAAAMTLLAMLLILLFVTIPRYSAAPVLGVSRPSLIFVPVLWTAVAILYWRRRHASVHTKAFTFTAIIFVAAHLAALYSRSPNDMAAMFAHYGKFVGEALLLFCLTQVGAADTARRQQLEQEFTTLNRDLDSLVTDRTAQLRESEARAHLMLDSALDAVISIDEAGAITGWNPQAEKTFGWQRDEVMGRFVDQIVMPERFREAHRLGLERYLATGEAKVLNQRLELSALHRDGREFPVELTITPIRARGVVSFSSFIRDITDRKLAETRLQAQIGRMRLLEQITRAIGQRQDVQSIYQIVVRTLEDQLPADFVCICRYDRLGQKLTVAHVGVTSVPLAQQLGMTADAEIAVDRNGLSRCVAGELVYEPDIAQVDYPFPNRLAAQGLRSLVVAPLMIDDEVFGVLVVSRLQDNSFPSIDCEFLRQLGEHVALAAHQAGLRDNLQRAYDDLRRSQQAVLEQERLRAIGQMASGIAHDINNAITPVSLYTRALIEQEPDMSPDLRDYVELVGRVSKDIAATIGRLRDFYRRSDEEADLTALNLNEIVPQVVELTRARWSDMPQQQGVVIKVSTDLEADLPPVRGNATELREALTNLIFNAVDAMPHGGTVTIRTQSSRHRGNDRPRVRLEVADTGVGMDEETRSRCLDPFFTTKGERGTGLGLAMVYGAAQRHNARLDIATKAQAGTCIALDFAAMKRERKSSPAKSRTQVQPLKLLLVDDDPAVLHSTMFVLRRDGHEIVTADGGQTAIEALQAAQETGEGFDAVITDLGMPYVDGNQVARTVKELFPATPVILQTGWGRRLAQGDEAPAHIDYLLPKPLEIDELRAIFAGLNGSDAES